jgi:hypothetical protein
MALSNQDRNANQKFTTEIVAPGVPSNKGGIRYSRQILQQFAQCQAVYDQKRNNLDYLYKVASAAIQAKLDAELIELARQLTNCKLSVANGEPYSWFFIVDLVIQPVTVSVTPTECEGVYQNLVRAAHDEYRRQIDILDKEFKEGRNRGAPGYDTILQEYIDCLSDIKYTPVTPEDVRRILS